MGLCVFPQFSAECHPLGREGHGGMGKIVRKLSGYVWGECGGALRPQPNPKNSERAELCSQVFPSALQTKFEKTAGLNNY